MTETDPLIDTYGDRPSQERDDRLFALAIAAVQHNEHVIFFEENVGSQPPIDNNRKPEDALQLGPDEILD